MSKSVPTADGVWYHSFSETACVVGGTLYGCSFYAGIPLAYEFSIGDTREDCDDAPQITLGSPVLFLNLAERLPFSPDEVCECSRTIVPPGKDMLCFSHTYFSNFTFDYQHLSIKILQIQDPLSLSLKSIEFYFSCLEH